MIQWLGLFAFTTERSQVRSLALELGSYMAMDENKQQKKQQIVLKKGNYRSVQNYTHTSPSLDKNCKLIMSISCVCVSRSVVSDLMDCSPPGFFGP